MDHVALPLKYAICGFISGPVGIFLWDTLGSGQADGSDYLTAAIAAGFGAGFAGWLKQRRSQN